MAVWPLWTCAPTETYNPGDPASEDFRLLRLLGLIPGPAADPAASPAVIVLFATSGTHNGNLMAAGSGASGRAGADNLCTAQRTSTTFAPNNRCSKVHAFLSISASDEIADMPSNYAVPSNTTIVSANGTVIADDFTALLSTTTDRKSSLQAAGVLTNVTFWSHSTTDGLLSGTNCTGSTATGASGSRGSSTTATSAWLNSGGPVGCSITETVLCVCYE